MPRSLTQYRVFIGSPGGLQEERKRFRELLERYSKVHGEPAGVVFHPVGWEDTLGGVGRPQEIINRDLEPCDFAVFVLHDRWGSPTGNGKSSGTEEELERAEKLYAETKLRNILLFFKQVSDRQLRDPGEQLQKVLDFRRRIEGERRYLHQQYSKPDEFRDMLEAHLAQWLREHDTVAGRALAVPASGEGISSVPSGKPPFEYWMAEARRLLNDDPADPVSAVFCAQKARAIALTEDDWAAASNVIGRAQVSADQPAAAYGTVNEIIDKFEKASSIEGKRWLATALFNKAVVLSALNRRVEEVAAYDDLIARVGAADDVELRTRVLSALFFKGNALRSLERGEDAIAAYDDAATRFGKSTEAEHVELLAKALLNKGYALSELNRNSAAKAAYKDVIVRFRLSTDEKLKALVTEAEAFLSTRP